MNSFLDGADDVLGMLILAGIPAYLLLQVWTAIELRRAWRLASMVPLALAVAMIVWCFRALAGDSGLWPVPLIFFAPIAAIYLLGLLGIRKAAAHAA
ncbi:MAG: hypothetical protein ABI377_07710 [Devosia sp.]